MNLKSCTETSANRRKLEIEVDAQSFAKAYNDAFVKLVKKINVPGFRKGKAPKSVVEKLYGKEYIYEDAVNAIYPEALEEAIKAAELNVIEDHIDLDVVSVGDEGLVFAAEVTVYPEVKLSGEYKGMKATRSAVNVTDEQIDSEVEAKREQNARLIDVEGRPAENGDTALFDFAGYVDDVAFEGGTAENYSLELGSGNFIPGFEEQMVGHSAGEEFDVNVTFPEEYHADELAGKEAVFKIKLHSLKVRELPVVDDEWITEISEFDTVDEYRADIRKNLEEKAEAEAKASVDDQLIDALVDMLDCEIPEAMIERRVDANINDFAYRLQAQGLSMDDYMKYLNLDADTLRSQMRPNAEKQVQMRLALEYIVEQEKIEISEEELDVEYGKLAEMYKTEVENVKAAINADDLKGDLAVEKAIAVIRDNADVTVED